MAREQGTSGFPERFERMLAAIGLSRAEFCQLTGFSQQAVNAWIKRQRVGTPSHDRLRKLTGVSLEWLNHGAGLAFPDGPALYRDGRRTLAPARVAESPAAAYGNNSSQSTDRTVLRMAVTAVAEGLRRAEVEVPPETLAELVELAYDMLAGARDPQAMRPQVVRLVAIQGGKP